MTRGRAAAALGFFVAIAAVAAGARAEGPEPPGIESGERPRVAILFAEGDPFGMRLAAELTELGFDALLIAPEGEATSRASLDASAREAGAMAAIRAVPSGQSVEVWLADRGTGKTLAREMADNLVDPDSALVLRTVELLRASLLDVALPEEPASEAPIAPDVARAPDVRPPDALAVERPLPSPAPPPSALRFALAPGVLLSPGGFSPIPALGMGIDWRLSDNVGVVALGTMPLSGASAESPEGTMKLTVWMAGAAARLFLTEPQSLWAPSIDVGALVLHLESGGRPEEGFIALSSSAWAAAPFVDHAVLGRPIDERGAAR